MPKNNDSQRTISPSEKKSEKFLEARESLPENLQGIYDRLVDEYHFATIEKFGAGYVAYCVLAELVRSGWRPSNNDNDITVKPMLNR